MIESVLKMGLPSSKSKGSHSSTENIGWKSTSGEILCQNFGKNLKWTILKGADAARYNAAAYVIAIQLLIRCYQRFGVVSPLPMIFVKIVNC